MASFGTELLGRGLAPAGRLRPEDIAAEAFHLVKQDRSGWTFELDLRPLHESW